MKKLLFYIVLVLFLVPFKVYSQKTVTHDNFTFQVQKEVGDLNKDTYEDKVVVEMDIEDETRPLRVQIFLSQPDKTLQLVVSSTQLIESQYPTNRNGEHNGNVIPGFFIEGAKLIMLTDINNRKSRYEFRLNENNVELIKISRVVWDGKDTTFETEIDFLAKTKIEFEQELGNDKILNKRKEAFKVNSLPKIQELKFSELESF